MCVCAGQSCLLDQRAIRANKSESYSRSLKYCVLLNIGGLTKSSCSSYIVPCTHSRMKYTACVKLHKGNTYFLAKHTISFGSFSSCPTNNWRLKINIRQQIALSVCARASQLFSFFGIRPLLWKKRKYYVLASKLLNFQKCQSFSLNMIL